MDYYYQLANYRKVARIVRCMTARPSIAMRILR